MDHVINFGTKDPNFRSKIIFNYLIKLFLDTFPKLELKILVHPFNWQKRIIKKYVSEVFELIHKLKNEKEVLSLKKELKLQVDPWDSYFYLDSHFFLKLLMPNVQNINYTNISLL